MKNDNELGKLKETSPSELIQRLKNKQNEKIDPSVLKGVSGPGLMGLMAYRDNKDNRDDEER